MSEYRKSQPVRELLDGTPYVVPPLSDSFRKSQYLLGFTIDTLFLHTPLSHVLFVTITFAKPFHSTKAAHTKLNTFLNKLRLRHRDYLWVLEPQESGRIHYHLLIPVDFDAHDGTDLDAWRDHDVFPDVFRENSMNVMLKAESDWWQSMAPRYGFGRIEVAPIYSNVEAIRKYMTKQDWRTRHWPFVEKKSVRFWSCSASLRAGYVNFAWNSPGGQACRARLKEWAHQHGCLTYDDLPIKLGKNWGYQFHQHLIHRRAMESLNAGAVVDKAMCETSMAGGRECGRTADEKENKEGVWSAPVSDRAARPMALAWVEWGSGGDEHEAAFYSPIPIIRQTSGHGRTPHRSAVMHQFSTQ